MSEFLTFFYALSCASTIHVTTLIVVNEVQISGRAPFLSHSLVFNGGPDKLNPHTFSGGVTVPYTHDTIWIHTINMSEKASLPMI